MTKQMILAALHAAKDAHIGWRMHAQWVITGLDVEARAPVLHTHCVFGAWYYGEGQALRHRCSEFDAIEMPHQQLHDTYLQIHRLLCDDQNNPKTSRQQSGPRPFAEQDVSQARRFLQELVGVSDELLRRILLLEKQVKAM